MNALDLYVYKCPNGHTEQFSAESVSPPEAHLEGKEQVYCGGCKEDREMTFKGLAGLTDESYVLENDKENRYCPLCKGACTRVGQSFMEHGEDAFDD